jgi:hypothetical protein
MTAQGEKKEKRREHKECCIVHAIMSLGTVVSIRNTPDIVGESRGIQAHHYSVTRISASTSMCFHYNPLEGPGRARRQLVSDVMERVSGKTMGEG